MTIRPFKPQDVSAIKTIINNLHPKWFDEFALKNIPIDAVLGKTFIAEENSEIFGFLILSSLEGQVWINWMGVDPSHHGQNIGSQLLLQAENLLKKLGVKELRVDTVVEQEPPDGSYDQTVKFYLKNGFSILKKHEQQTFEQFVYCRGILNKDISK